MRTPWGGMSGANKAGYFVGRSLSREPGSGFRQEAPASLTPPTCLNFDSSSVSRKAGSLVVGRDDSEKGDSVANRVSAAINGTRRVIERDRKTGVQESGGHAFLRHVSNQESQIAAVPVHDAGADIALGLLLLGKAADTSAA